MRDERYALQDFRIMTGHEKLDDETVLSLAPPHLLEGRVTFGDSGQPAVGARLHVIGYQSPTTTQSFDRIEGQTGPDGRFRISASVAHHYGIVVDPPLGSPYFLRRLSLNATEGGARRSTRPWNAGSWCVVESSSRTRAGRWQGPSWSTGPSGRRIRCSRKTCLPPGDTASFWQSVASTAHSRSPLFPARVTCWSRPRIPISSRYEPARENSISAHQAVRVFTPSVYSRVDLDGGTKVADVSIPLRRGVTLEGRVVGPDGQSVPIGRIYSEAVDSAGFEFDFSDLPIQDGRFTLKGLEPEKTFSAFIIDPKGELGAALQLSVPRDGHPLTVTLHPCGSARTRLVDPAGKPLAKFGPSDLQLGLEMSIRLSSSGDARDRADKFATTLVENIDHDRFQTLRTDGQGRLNFPSLIPGATYRMMAGELGWVMKKEFVAEAGQTVELPEITIQSPR